LPVFDERYKAKKLETAVIQVCNNLLPLGVLAELVNIGTRCLSCRILYPELRLIKQPN
jgi:hypothetical protein